MFLIGLLILLAGLIGLLLIWRAPRLVRSAGKPLAEPRILTYLDAWQTVVFEAGKDAAEVKERILAGLRESGERFSCRVERIWHWGLDGKIEREQIVMRHERAIVFCQVHGYGTDLYVGWDAHLNLGTWSERVLASGVDRQTGERIQLMSVEPTRQAVNEYDVVDVNCLLEWTHAQVSKVLRQYTKEKQIDQEINFTIIRGDRKDVAPANRAEQKSRGFFTRKA